MLELTSPDRARIDNLTAELARYNDRLNAFAEVLVSCTEAARLLGKTKATISTYIAQGKLQKRTIGLSTGIPLGEVLRLKAQ